MQVKILGSAAGGAFPQWNCACPNCDAVRGGQFQGKPRSQTQIAVSSDGEAWFLLGASPDLRSQIESTPELHPRSGIRSSPIRGVVLASADLDHVLGLLLMRELQPYPVYAAEPVIKILRDNNDEWLFVQVASDGRQGYIPRTIVLDLNKFLTQLKQHHAQFSSFSSIDSSNKLTSL